MKTKVNPNRKPMDWQREPERITTERVQYWREGTMRTAMMSRDAARDAVKSGTAFVITSQAIGALDEHGNYLS